MSRKIVAVLLFLIFFALYLWLGLQAYRHGFTSQHNLFYAEKALLALKGDPPRLENVGLVYPPLPFLLTLLPPYPFVGGVLIGALLSTFLVLRVSRVSSVGGITKASFLILLLASFPVLFLVTQRPAVTVFFALFVLANFFLLRFHESGYTLNIFLFGITYGLSFLAAYEAIFLLPYYLVVCVTMIPLRNRGYIFSTILVIALPSLFFLAAWTYLNWIFTQDPLHFLHSPYSYFLAYREFTPLLAQTKGRVLASLSFTVLWSLPFALPYYLLLPFVKKKQRRVRIDPALLIYLAPFWLLLLEVYLGFFHNSLFRLSLFLFFAALFIPRVTHRIVLKIVPVFLIVALIWSWWAAWKSPEREERILTRVVVGSEFSPPMAVYQQVVDIIRKGEGRVLLDDSQLYPIVALDRLPKRYLLPYNYEFPSALSQPSYFVEYVVVYTDPVKDRIASAWPDVMKGRLPGFYPVFTKEKIVVFRRSS